MCKTDTWLLVIYVCRISHIFIHDIGGSTAFSALTLGHLDYKNWVVGCWHGYLTVQTCIWPS